MYVLLIIYKVFYVLFYIIVRSDKSLFITLMHCSFQMKYIGYYIILYSGIITLSVYYKFARMIKK